MLHNVGLSPPWGVRQTSWVEHAVERRRGRRLLIFVLGALFLPVLGLLAGLVTNEASAQSRWPGWLDAARTHPWLAFFILGTVLIIGGAVAALLDGRAALESEPEPRGDHPVVLPKLPRDNRAFMARDGELRQLAAIASDGGQSESLSLAVIEGLAGVGKTTLALHAGHLLASQFPDGQVLVNLHGHTPGREPADPADALLVLLTAIGVPSNEIPTGLDRDEVTAARGNLWRKLVSDRRMFIILDDAISAHQVDQLLPGDGQCFVIVTSRRMLSTLDGDSMTLASFSPNDAAELFYGLSKRRPEEIPRSQAVEVARLCGFLPLAVSLAASRLRRHPEWSVDNFVSRLSSATSRLDEIRAGDVAVAAAFELSYAGLPADAQSFFVRLGLHPGAELEPYAAANVAGVTLAESTARLDLLYEDHLLEVLSFGRYRMHDLVREFVRQRADQLSTKERSAARVRLFNFYDSVVRAASNLVSRRVSAGSAVSVDERVSPAPALIARPVAHRWLVDERQNLLACLEYQIDHGFFGHVARMALWLSSFLRQAGPWDQAIAVQEKGVRAARAGHDDDGEARCMLELGVVQRRLGDLESAHATLLRVKKVMAGMPHRGAYANVLNELGVTERALGRPRLALTLHDGASAIFEEEGDVLGQARTQNYLGVSWAMCGEIDAAERSLGSSLELFQEGADPHGQASVLTELGALRRSTGDISTAVTLGQSSRRLFESLGDRHGVANASCELGLSLIIDGATAAGAEALAVALEIYESYGNNVGRAQAHNNMGYLSLVQGSYQMALRQFSTALDYAIAARLPQECGRALEGKARAFSILGDVAKANGHLGAALEVYGEFNEARQAALRRDFSS